MILDDTRGTMVPMDAEPENGDYTGEDGLLYCGACHTPKEAYFPEGNNSSSETKILLYLPQTVRPPFTPFVWFSIVLFIL